jgi:subtilisin-like proprotein convertase family protein
VRRPTLVSLLGAAAVLVGLAVAGGSGHAAANTVFPGTSIAINDCCNNTGAVTGTASTAGTYPSTVTVGATAPPTVGKVRVTVTLDANWPDDIQLLLVNPDGTKKVILMANAGGNGGNAISPDTLTFDDGGGPIPDNTQLKDGTYHPTSLAGDCDNQASPTNFPSPAPASPYSTALSAFNGTPSAGQWKLYVIDDCNLGNVGASITSWSLEITGPTAVTVNNFSARRVSRAVQLRWRTATETEALGFNVYRFSHGSKMKVNRGLIVAKRSGTARGAAYTLRDTRAGRTAATYRLQAVSLRGKRTWAASSSIRARR